MENTRKGNKINKALMMGSALVSLGALSVSEAQAVTVTGLAMTGVVLAPIAITSPTSLHFGSVTVTAATGTVVINTAGARSVTGAVTAVAGAALESQGVLSITAATGLAIDLSMAATSYTVNDGGGNTMVVNNFNLVTNAGGTAEIITLAAATETRALGATLNVGASQVPGTYTGTYSLVANYQ